MNYQIFYFSIILTVAVLIKEADLQTTSNVGRQGARIFFGRETPIQDVPYMVALLNDGKLLCGGGILSEMFVVSSAQCINSVPVTANIVVRVGSSDYAEGGEEISVLTYLVHEKYNQPLGAYDVAVLKTKTAITKQFPYKELTLPRKNPVEGEKIVISGWGKTMNGQLEAVRNLTSGTQMVVKNETCIEKFEEWFILFPFTDFCAENSHEEQDPCEKDMGGPAVKDGNVLVGIISIPLCGYREFISGYTNVYVVSDWIRHAMERLRKS